MQNCKQIICDRINFKNRRTAVKQAYKKVSISKLTALIPCIKEHYDKRHGNNVVLRCLTHFYQRFLVVCRSISRSSSVLSPVAHQQLTAGVGRAWHYRKNETSADEIITSSRNNQWSLTDIMQHAQTIVLSSIAYFPCALLSQPIWVFVWACAFVWMENKNLNFSDNLAITFRKLQ